MKRALSLIYGRQVLDDLEFCRQHGQAIERYAHGIMTLQGSPKKALDAVARDPTTVFGWKHSLDAHPEDVQLLREFLTRLIAHYVEIGRFERRDT